MIDTKKSTIVDSAMSALNKKHGECTVLKMSDHPSLDIESETTGLFVLDEVLGVGGLPRGRTIELFGQESCLAGDTFISYTLRDKNGKNQNSKGGTLKRFYERFNNIKRSGKGNYQKKQTIDSTYHVSSINENNAIIKNRVLDVVSTGIKECFRVTTVGGHSLTCTDEHNFYIGNGNYVPLKDLSVGLVIYAHNNTTLKGRAPQIRYKEIYVKYHPSATIKIVNGYTYYRVKKSHIVYEAELNGYSPDDYIKALNKKSKEILNRFSTIQKGMIIHHINFDPSDDRLENLLLLSGVKHNRLHALNNGDKLNFVVTEDIIKSIKSVGKIPTYDIKCNFPYNNYVANKIVVHNSGKSTLAMHIVAEIQKKGGKAVFIDAEHAFNPEYAHEVLGVNVDDLIISQPKSAEEAFDIIQQMVKTNEIDIIVVDSTAALVPQKELDGEIAGIHVANLARMMSQSLRILTSEIANSKTIVLFINQVRDKIGQFYGAKTTTPGGRALKFYSSVRLEVIKTKALKRGDDIVGNEILIKVVKNKVAPPFKNCKIELDYEKGINRELDIINMALVYGLVVKEGNTYSLKTGKEMLKLGVGIDHACRALRDKPETIINLRTLINKEIKIKKELLQPKDAAVKA